jgi:hypothetical protein
MITNHEAIKKRSSSPPKRHPIAQVSKDGKHKTETAGCPNDCVFELIQRAAHQLFEWHGSQPGRELDNWLEAEHEIKLQLK